MRSFKKTPKQIQAIELMKQYVEVLLEGGSRSGKTFIGLYAVIVRSINHQGSRHLVVRRHFNHIKLSIWYQTFPKVLETAFPNLNVKENKSDWFLEFPNNSQLWIAGTDDKERIEKILGSEWDTIFLNEASQMSYDIYDMFKTRLNPQGDIKPLYLIDYNPPNKRHWGYKIFHKGLNPENDTPVSSPDRYCRLKMNPEDNKDNLSETYIDTLYSMSEKKQKRFLRGEYSDDTENALWKRAWIIKNRLTECPNNINRKIVAIDPNVTEDKKAEETTDEAGIVTVGKFKINGEDHYSVHSDDSVSGFSWGQVACEVYAREQADKIIAEVNQGGDLVKMNIRNYNKHVPYESVRATRGKEVRAEPVADLYRRGYVHHIGEFTELEGELCEWVPGESRSPNRLDAVVWGVAYLSGTMNGEVVQITGW